ncbi:MAG: adenylyl-sulfate kinase [Actinobacteria bacterium]|nr:adenylyl-sulfate kinase [Actinomycetota bacterium]MBW3649284.1 adenylyl-sulfate kinase [Actinomycetota bacterium]
MARRRLDDGMTVWLTGLPSAGKTTLARGLEKRLLVEGYRAEILDGDDLRARIGRELGFSREDRNENVRRIGFIAHLLSRNGVVAVCSVISPYRESRDELRALHGERFFEVHVATPVDVCGERDVKGLYARQRAGEISMLTGVDDVYEEPLAPEVVVPTHLQTVEQSVAQVWDSLVAWCP